MKKTAFIFPGQGSQALGMGKTLFEGFKEARQTFEEADSVLGFSLSKLCFDGPASELDRTEITQPALLVTSMAALRVLGTKSAVTPFCLAGHSLGEYTALVAAGSLSFADAVKVVHLRGRYMQEGVPQGTGRMSAILGLDAEAVAGICAEASSGGSVAVSANINGLQQIVISGHAAAVERAEALAKEKGAKKVVPLQVSAPSHSPLMEGAAARLKAELDKISIKAPAVPVYSNVEAAPMPGDGAAIKGLLARQLTSPVRWVEIIKALKAAGVERAVEIGSGRVLTGLVKRIEDMELLNLGEALDVEKVAAALGS